MINIGPINPPVSKPKVISPSARNAAAAGTETNKDAQRVEQHQQKRRRGKDRRQKKMKPLIDLRSGKDRRNNPDIPSIDIEV